MPEHAIFFFKAFFKLFMCFDLSYSTCGLWVLCVFAWNVLPMFLCGNWKTWSNKSFYKVTKEHVSASYTDRFYNLINFSLWCWFWFLCQKANTRHHTFPQELNEFLLFCQYHQRGLKQAYFNYLPLMLTFCPEVIKNLGLSTLILAHSLVSVAVLFFWVVFFKWKTRSWL